MPETPQPGTGLGEAPRFPLPDVRFEPGLWVADDRLRAKISLEYLAFRARKRSTRSPLRVPSLAGERPALSWTALAAEVWDLFCAARARQITLYRVAPGASRAQEPLRCAFWLAGKQSTVCFGWCRRGPRVVAAVDKLCRTPAQFERESRARRLLGRHLRMPSYTVDSARLAFREGFVTGHLLVDATADRQVSAIEALIDAYTALTASQPRASSGSAPKTLGALLEHSWLGRVMEPHRPTLESGGWEAEAARVLCHNDLSGSNVILDDEGGPVVIDFERAEINVFHADVLWLVCDLAVRSQPHGLHTLRAGGFDHPLQALWHAAGSQYDRRRLPAYLAMAICEKTRLDVEALGPDCWSARTFAQRMALVRDCA